MTIPRAPLRQIWQSAGPTRRVHSPSLRPLIRAPRLQPANGQRRHGGSFTGNAKLLFSKHPFTTSLATFFILCGAAGLVYVNYIYQTYIIAAFHKYPEPVAKKLRRAVYYSKTDVQPSEAIKYYKQALEVAQELQMHPFSDEVMGIKIEVAALMEKIQQNHKAIEVLERVRADNLAWLEKSAGVERDKKRRTKVLAKTVAITVKLGELYGSPAIWDRDTAQERLVWAVETVLKEKQRRANEKVTEEDEGEWMTDDEHGATLESLAHSYEAKGQHFLAAPLFLQALHLHPTKDCHAVVLMNNLASSIAQQSPRAAREAQAYAVSQNINERPVGPAATKESMIENAKQWAQKAIDVAAAIQPPARNEECDVGCAVAMHNLGEFAERSKDMALARQKYQEAVRLARAIGFEEGVEQSSARLREIAQAG